MLICVTALPSLSLRESIFPASAPLRMDDLCFRLLCAHLSIRHRLSVSWGMLILVAPKASAVKLQTNKALNKKETPSILQQARRLAAWAYFQVPASTVPQSGCHPLPSPWAQDGRSQVEGRRTSEKRHSHTATSWPPLGECGALAHPNGCTCLLGAP